MKGNFKINTLRGIFLCLTRYKDGLCPRTVFSQPLPLFTLLLQGAAGQILQKNKGFAAVGMVRFRLSNSDKE
jgi:hypothetical protein